MENQRLEQLWDEVGEPGGAFDPASVEHLPEPARRYLRHAISPGTLAPSTVRLQMHGEIKLGKWWPFEAEQVTHAARGFVWAARVKMWGLPVTGFDQLIDGQAKLHWKMLGLLPVMSAEGDDAALSALGRMQGEVVWMPSMLLPPAATWSAEDSDHAQVTFSLLGESVSVDVDVDPDGRPRTVSLQRWGDPDDSGESRWLPFGAILEEERTFEGFTVPTKLRVGWHFAGDHFEQDGEFFRATIERVSYR